VVCLGYGATGAQGRDVVDAAMQAGAVDVQVIEEPLAAALGANVPVSSASANMVVDIGAAWTKAAVLSLNHTIVSHSVGIGGNKIDEMIASYVRRMHNLIIGERTAEQIKFATGSALPLENDSELEVRGRDATDGLPTLRSVRSSELTETIRGAPVPIVRVVKMCSTKHQLNWQRT
jgi:rod shape-determining protein MreB and related proteins